MLVFVLYTSVVIGSADKQEAARITAFWRAGRRLTDAMCSVYMHCV